MLLPTSVERLTTASALKLRTAWQEIPMDKPHLYRERMRGEAYRTD